MSVGREKPQKEPERSRDWRDKPVEQEADKDVKEGGLGGAKRERETADKR